MYVTRRITEADRITMSMSEPKKRKYTELTVQQKIELIRYVDAKNSIRSAAQTCKVSTGTASNIVAERANWLQLSEDVDTKTRQRHIRTTPNAKINEAMWVWFQKMRAIGVPLTGPMLQALTVLLCASMCAGHRRTISCFP